MRMHHEGNGVVIDDTFAEAFGMRATAIIITAPTPQMGAAGGDHHDRLRHLGHRLRLRGGDRQRICRRRKRRTAGRAAVS